MQQIPRKWIEKHQKEHYVHKNTNKHKLNIYSQKFGLFNDINNKKSISETKSIYKNNYNLHLSNNDDDGRRIFKGRE